jgi:hypothetical protein
VVSPAAGRRGVVHEAPRRLIRPVIRSLIPAPPKPGATEAGCHRSGIRCQRACEVNPPTMAPYAM